jgi:hypothetical protein
MKLLCWGPYVASSNLILIYGGLGRKQEPKDIKWFRQQNLGLPSSEGLFSYTPLSPQTPFASFLKVYNWMWWPMPVIKATWEMEEGGPRSKASLGESMRPLSEKQTKRVWLKRQSTCIASMSLQFKPQYFQNKKVHYNILTHLHI